MAASSLPRHRVYDVFLSFRGTDTRKAIVSHLYEALDTRGIITFKDDRGLEKGDPIYEELCRAIEGSRFAVVVLSENYATSKWCLMELQLIMELMDEERIQVIPVFYGSVDPSMVRHQRGSFDLRMYEGTQMADKVPKWRDALNQISNLAGVESRNCIDEAKMVREIATDISRQVSLMHKIDSRNFVGMKALIDGLNTLLDLKSSIMGIWGMGGIGKTTIAKCLFDQLSPEFPARCFIENIRSIYKDGNHDLMRLQKKFLSSILPIGDDLSLWSVEAGEQEIKARLGNRKVLLVIDGVDKVPQVHALTKEMSWFGPGSRIIITTRDRGLLNSCGVNTLYEVKCLDDKDSLQLFKQIAFEGGSPPEGFEQLSVRASRLAHGLPSAVRAHALFLRRWSESPEWEEAICGLEGSLDENIMEILKISYEGLSRPRQNVLLHVACLFNGETLQRVISLLDGSRPERSMGMRDLAEKSLLKISTNGCVIMHKLVEQMGKQIMHDCRKFLGDPEEIRDALAIREGTEDTECMSLHMCEITYAFSLVTSAVDHMYNLKFLKVYKHLDDSESRLQIVSDSHDLPYNLRLCHWDAFPLSTLPLRFSPYRLVELNLRHSNLKTLWSGTPDFMELKRLDVTGSKYLQRLPDLSNTRSLEELILEQCTCLEGIPESIGTHSTLKKLKLSYRRNPKSPLYVHIWELAKYITLGFPDVSVMLDEIMDLSIEGDMLVDSHSFVEGYVDYLSLTCTQQTPTTSTTSAHQAPRLSSGFSKFDSLIIMRSHKEIFRPFKLKRFKDLPKLKELKLINLNIEEIPDGIHHLTLLEKLDLSGNDFKYLPEAMNDLSRLKALCLRNCSRLKKLPELTQVQTLTLSNCISLAKLPSTSQDRGIYGLLELSLENCNSVESLSEQLSHFTKLTYLDLSDHEFETLPPSIRDLSSLVTLCLNNCKNLKSVEELPRTLQFLDVHGCDSLEADSVEHFNSKLYNKANLRNDCFQETETPSCVRNHKAIKSHQIIRVPKITHALMFVGIPICITLVAVLVIFLLRVL